MAVMLAAVAGVLLAGTAARADQRQFPTAEAALETFVDELGKADPQGLAAIFGEEHMDALLGDDPAAARADLARAHALTQEAAALRPAGPDRMVIVVGRTAWPFPVPLVRGAGGWRFDTAAGVEEIADRRVGRNELAAIEVMGAYVAAQRLYAKEDRDGDRVLEFAQHLRSMGDRRDGLYWPTSEGEPPSPFGPFVAGAADYLEGKQAGDSYRGYRFRVLTGQGPHAPGGAYGYVINGHMVAGFALLAWPAEYGDTGVMSFVVGNDGIVLESDLGPGTEERATATAAYDPDPSWRPVVE